MGCRNSIRGPCQGGRGKPVSPTEFAVDRLGLRPYRWQAECMEALAMQPETKLPVAAAAANGSGKTTALAGPLVAWFFEKYPRGKVIVTSGSFNQLQNQLWPALAVHSRGLWKITSGSSPLTITTPSGGKAIGFSTSDAKRAEGWHPTISPEVDPVFIIVDEAKGVPDEIFGAFQRCTVKYQLWISSPGAPGGRFHTAFYKGGGLYWTKRVTSMECPHISPEKRERDRIELGEDSPLYRSMHLAEFTSLDGRVILTPESLEQAFEIQPEADASGEKVAFCDFAAGGDENALAWRWGNEVKLHAFWRDSNTTQARREFRQHFDSIQLHHGQVWGDADGIGNVIIKDFAEEGFRLNEFHGGTPARDPVNYANLISEYWIEACRDIERGKVHIGPRHKFDPVLFEQLTTRRLEWDSKGRLRIECKDDMRARGVKSPDRADAYIGAIMCGGHMSGAITSHDIIASPSVNRFGSRFVRGW
jgi:phage terminase large subunit